MHCLSLGRELMRDSVPLALINFINIYHIFETLNAATTSKWLFMNSEVLTGLMKASPRVTSYQT